MGKAINASFDIGSSLVRCVITTDQDGELCILGVGTVPSEGVRRGVIVDVDDVSRAIVAAAEMAEEMSGEYINEAIVSVSGAGVEIEDVRGVVAVERPDAEVTEGDIENVLASAEAIAVPTDKEIIHVLPRVYRLDNQENIKDPLGLRGIRLEVDAVAIHAPKSAVESIAEAMEMAEIKTYEYAIEPLAAGAAVLTKKQKELGVALVNLGASTTSIAIYEEGEIIHTAVLGVGSDYITHDLAIGLRTSLGVAEEIKRQFGTVASKDVDEDAEIDLHAIDPEEEGSVLHSHVVEIIMARLEEIFTLVRDEIIKAGKDQLLPAGAVLTGGGNSLVGIAEFAKKALRLPVSIGIPREYRGVVNHISDPSHATAIGLVVWHNTQNPVEANASRGQMMGTAAGKVGTFFGAIKNGVMRFVKRLLP